jgi:HAMP domain-containing protein
MVMEEDMSADVTHVEREAPRPLHDEVSAGHGPAGGSFNPLDSSQRQLDGVLVSQLLSPRVAVLPHFESEHEFLHSLRQHLLTDPDHRLERSNQAAARVGGTGSAGVSLVETDLVAETRGLPPAERQRGTPPVAGRTEMNEVRLAFRALIEQVRLVLRDGRRLIRRIIAVCDTFKPSIRAPMTSTPALLASVPLVVLRATTEREQIELSDLVQSLSAEGYQVARHGPQWVVYTEITERRTSAVSRSAQKGSGTSAMRERVEHGSLPHCRSDDRPH